MMKKITMVLIAMILILSTYVFAENSEYCFTNNLRNGFSLKNENAFDKYNTYGYIEGLANALEYQGLINLNEGWNQMELKVRIEKYYEDNPKNGYEPILEVMLKLFGTKNINKK